MLHINVMDAKPRYNARLQLQMRDLFASDDFTLKQNILQKKDSLPIRIFMEGLLDKDVDFEIIARGNGVAEKVNEIVGKSSNVKELKAYPGRTPEERAKNREKEGFAELRLSEVFIQMGRVITLEVNSFTDPVVSNLAITDEDHLEKLNDNAWTKNDLLSVYRTEAILKKLKAELNVLASEYFTRAEAKVIIDRLNKQLAKTNIAIGSESLKVKI